MNGSTALSQLSFTEQFVMRAHAGQRYGEKPYICHVTDVASLSMDVLTQEAQRAIVGAKESLAVRAFLLEVAYLHDVLEDTPITAEVLDRMFGEHVAAAVDLLTDPPGQNRRERKARLYKKMSIARHAWTPPAATDTTVADWVIMAALVAKCADRLANVHNALATGRRDLVKMYDDEHAAFRGAFYCSYCKCGFSRIEELLHIGRDPALPKRVPLELLSPSVV